MDTYLDFGYRLWIPVIWIQSNPDRGRYLQFCRVALKSHFFTLISISNRFRISIQQHSAQTPAVRECLDSLRSRCSNIKVNKRLCSRHCRVPTSSCSKRIYKSVVFEQALESRLRTTSRRILVVVERLQEDFVQALSVIVCKSAYQYSRQSVCPSIDWSRGSNLYRSNVSDRNSELHITVQITQLATPQQERRKQTTTFKYYILVKALPEQQSFCHRIQPNCELIFFLFIPKNRYPTGKVPNGSKFKFKPSPP